MRFPVPDRLNFTHVAIFASLVFIGQALEGTDFLFAVLTASYILLWAAAFNLAGGVTYTSGAFIFFNGLLNVVIGFTYKIFLGQPGERNLLAPIATMFCYCVGMIAMLVAAFVCRGLRPERGLLRGFDSLRAMKSGAIVCLVGGIVVTTIVTLGGVSTNPVITGLRQINKLPQMAVMLATTYEVLHSGGKRTTNWIVVVGVSFLFVAGLISFGKEGILMGFVAWFIAAVFQGYNFPKRQLVGGLLAFAFFNYYLVPYSQYVRNFKATTFVENEAIALHYLMDLGETRRLYVEAIAEYDLNQDFHFFDQRQGFMDRLLVIAEDDALIHYTNQGNVFGLAPTIVAYGNVVPRFIWRNKPMGGFGNNYAHEIGLLADEDLTTGIEFSPTADAYHQAKWLGLLLLLPIDMFLYFIITDSIVGSQKWSPWALIPILDTSKIAAAGGLDAPVYAIIYGLFGILTMVWFIKHAAPFVLRVFRQPDFGALDIPLQPVTTSGISPTPRLQSNPGRESSQ